VLPGAASGDEKPGAKRIKIGQIGVAHGHATKLAVYRRSADYEVAGLVEDDAELRKKAETQDAFRGVPWMTREELLAVPGLQAVMSQVVASDERRRLARFRGGMMFELGCHVLDLILGILGKPKEVTPFAQHSSRLDDTLVDNMLAVLTYPRATATVKSSALEVEGFDRRHLVVCGTEGTYHIQPLDNPPAR